MYARDLVNSFQAGPVNTWHLLTEEAISIMAQNTCDCFCSRWNCDNKDDQSRRIGGMVVDLEVVEEFRSTCKRVSK